MNVTAILTLNQVEEIATAIRQHEPLFQCLPAGLQMQLSIRFRS
jgi:hypothetical protein